MKAADIVVLLLVAVAFTAAVVHSIRARKKRGCGCGCGACQTAASCGGCDKKRPPEAKPRRGSSGSSACVTGAASAPEGEDRERFRVPGADTEASDR